MEKYDETPLYCRMLGHNITFKYCRSMNSGLPCRKIRDCTFHMILIDDFLNEHYTPEQLQTAFKPPENRISSILNIIEKAKGSNES